MMAADWQSKVGILNRIGPSVPDTAPTRDRLAGEAEQLRRQAQSAQQCDRYLAMKSIAEDMNPTTRGKGDKRPLTRNRSERDS